MLGAVAGFDPDLQAFLVPEMVEAGVWFEPDGEMDPEALADQTCATVKRMLKLPRVRAV